MSYEVAFYISILVNGVLLIAMSYLWEHIIENKKGGDAK